MPHLKGWPFAAILDDQVNDLDGCDADEIAQAARFFPAEALAAVALRRAFSGGTTGTGPQGPEGPHGGRWRRKTRPTWSPSVCGRD